MARLLLLLVVLVSTLFACADEFAAENITAGVVAAGSGGGAATPAGGEAGSATVGGAGGSTEPGGTAGATATGGLSAGATGGEAGGAAAGGAGAAAGGGAGGLTAGGTGGTGGAASGGAGGEPAVSVPYAESCLKPAGDVCRWMGTVKLTCGADATCHCDYGTLCRDSRFVGKVSPDVCQAGPCAQEQEPIRKTCVTTNDCPGAACNTLTHECVCNGGQKLCRLKDGAIACALWCDY